MLATKKDGVKEAHQSINVMRMNRAHGTNNAFHNEIIHIECHQEIFWIVLSEWNPAGAEVSNSGNFSRI
jgi:hypothetical protein